MLRRLPNPALDVGENMTKLSLGLGQVTGPSETY